MKVIYLFVFITFIVILLLGKSIFSSASAESSSLGQTGGKKANTLRTLLYVILAVAAVIFILFNVRGHLMQVS